MINKRKIVLINPGFQIPFITRLLALSVVIILINLVTAWYFMGELRKVGLSVGLHENHPYFGFLAYQQDQMFVIFGISSAIIIAIVSVFALYYSHRIVGPIFQLKKYLTNIAQGNEVDKLVFRERDFFSELPELVVEAVKRLKEPPP